MPFVPGQGVFQSANASPVEALLKRAALLMEDGDWQKADERLERLLDNDPENAQAYFGKVLVQLKVPSAKVLTAKAVELGITSLKTYKDYEKALRFADPNFRFVLECYDPANREDIYQEITSLLTQPRSFEKCQKAMMLLEYIPQGYKEVDALTGQLKSAEQVYLKYKRTVAHLNESKSSTKFQDTLVILESMPDYEEIEALHEKCHEAIEDQAITEIKSTKDIEHLEALASDFASRKDLRNADVIIEKCHEAMYQLARAEIKSAKAVEDFETLARKFASTKGLRNAAVLVEECHGKSVIEPSYQKVVSLLNSPRSLDNYQNAAKILATIPTDYKDVAALTVECQRLIKDELAARERFERELNASRR